MNCPNKEKEYKIEVVTPMFLGGADKKAELRLPSIKGLLRFWWRATSEITDLRKLKAKEEEIFGSTEKKSKISLRVEDLNIRYSEELFEGEKVPVEGKSFPIDILHYLLIGLLSFKPKRFMRNYIAPKSSFTLKIFTPSKDIKEIERALKYLINFGGIGSKSRNGFGSLYCKDLYDNDLKFKEPDIDYPPFTALSEYSDFVKLKKSYDKWEDALSEAGIIYRNARLSLESTHYYDERAYIALPIVADDADEELKDLRHAKPVFINIKKLPDNRYQSQFLFMPYKYTYKGNFEDYKNATDTLWDKIKEEAEKNDK